MAILFLTLLFLSTTFAFPNVNTFLGNSSEGNKTFGQAAIACDAPYCSEIARGILELGGAIADAAIAGMVCMGVVHPQSSGIGGGLVAVHFDHKANVSTVLSAREQAPSLANESMFDGMPNGTSNSGGLAVAVPGEIRGFYELYSRFGGQVPWEQLFEPSIKLLEVGFRVDEHLAKAFKSAEASILRDPALREAYVNPISGKVWAEGEVMREPKLASTLKTIAKNGAGAFYDPTSTLAIQIVEDLKKVGGIISPHDLAGYTVQIQKPIKININGLTLHTAGPPSSGATMAFILRIMDKHRGALKFEDIDTSQVMVEAFKHAYGRRGKLGDPDDEKNKASIQRHVINLTENEEYLKEILAKIQANSTTNNATFYKEKASAKRGFGTAHFAIIGPAGDAISCTTTVGKFFGSKVRSPSTGIIFNNKMNNFLNNPTTRGQSPANKIGPLKRPMNTACPSIHTDATGKVRLVIGGAGGMKIISSVTFSTINNLWLDKTIQESIAAKRIHHALKPMVLDHEIGFNATILNALRGYGHVLKESPPTASVIGIARLTDDSLSASWDPRKSGSASTFNFWLPRNLTRKTTTKNTREGHTIQKMDKAANFLSVMDADEE